MTLDEPSYEISPLFLLERERLSDLLAGLDPADWQRPSPCPGWTVLGLCAHLAGDDLGFLARHLGQAPSEPGDTVTISVSGPVARTWFLVAAPAGWKFQAEPGSRGVAAMSMTTEQAWRLLTNNLPAAERSRITAAGDATILGILDRTRAIIGQPK